ncbi:unnamed protein product [Caenorhabditis bovis]|uniref:MARVEL domain-containing protein n=1 Tax=Caenorhabditis bovis TaxID=2654633 RepID=A0A8S1EW73_9PELO|nr:unnamed protein product [Caenorhabditis bovis]
MKSNNSFYFFAAIRSLAILCSIIVLFCIGLSQYWTNRVSIVFALLFVILAILFIGSSIATLFVWDADSTTLAKKCLFSFVYSLATLIAAILLLISSNGCDPKLIASYGCFQNVSTGTYDVAAAFCFIVFALGLLDVLLHCFFYYRKSRKTSSHIYDLPPPPPIAVLEPKEKSIHELYLEYQRKGQSTSV